MIYAQLQFDEIQRYASGQVEIMAQNPYLGLWVVLIIGILCKVRSMMVDSDVEAVWQRSGRRKT